MLLLLTGLWVLVMLLMCVDDVADCGVAVADWGVDVVDWTVGVAYVADSAVGVDDVAD